MTTHSIVLPEKSMPGYSPRGSKRAGHESATKQQQQSFHLSKKCDSINFAVFLRISCIYPEGFPGGSDGKSVCLQCGRPGFDPWVGKILWRRQWQPTPVLLPGQSHGRRSLIGYKSMGSQRVGHNWATSLSLSFHPEVRVYFEKWSRKAL